jgi:hypothetical protein
VRAEASAALVFVVAAPESVAVATVVRRCVDHPSLALRDRFCASFVRGFTQNGGGSVGRDLDVRRAT